MPAASRACFANVPRWVCLAVMFLGLSTAKGESFCALTVNVRFPDGRSARLQPVQLVDPQGKTVFDGRTDEAGSPVPICDFGFGDHRLVVGYGFCYRTTIDGVRFDRDHPIHLTVHLNRCPPHTSYGGCRVYLRIVDPADHPLSGVHIQWNNNEPDSVSDEFGRVWTYSVATSQTELTLKREGFSTQKTTISCTGGSKVDKTIVLSPSLP